MKLLFILMFIVSCADTGQRIDTENTIELFDTTTEITIKDLKNHIGFLASDELEGRASGTLGDEMAKDYIQAVKTNHKIGYEVEKMFKDFDVLLSPVLAKPPVKIGEIDLNTTDFKDYQEKLMAINFS